MGGVQRKENNVRPPHRRPPHTGDLHTGCDLTRGGPGWRAQPPRRLHHKPKTRFTLPVYVVRLCRVGPQGLRWPPRGGLQQPAQPPSSQGNFPLLHNTHTYCYYYIHTVVDMRLIDTHIHTVAQNCATVETHPQPPPPQDAAPGEAPPGGELSRRRSSYHLTNGQAAVELFLRLARARQTLDFTKRQVRARSSM